MAREFAEDEAYVAVKERRKTPKILVIHSALTPGGSTRVAVNDAVSLRNQGFTVGFASEKGKLGQELRARDIPVYSLYFVDSARYPRWVRYLFGVPVTTFLMLYYVMHYHYDCLYVQHRQSGIPSTVVSWLTGAKYVFISHCEQGTLNRGRFLTPLGRHIVAVSQQVKRNIIANFCASPDHVTVIPNATETNVVRADGESIRAFEKEWSLLPGQPVIAYVAMLVEVKAHDVLLAAWKIVMDQFPDAVLLLAGNGPLRGRLEALCIGLGISSRVRFLGYLQDVSIVYSRADFVVLSSRSEGMPTCILEASAYGLPAVATAVSGTPEIVKHEETGLLIEPDNVEQLGQGILRLLRDTALRQRLGRAARQLVESKYSAGARELTLVNYFRDLLKTR